jgi:hypothetical protein
VAPVFHQFALPVAATIVAFPFAVALAFVMAHARRRRGASAGWALRSSIAEVGLVIGTVPWVWMILTPDPGHPRGRNLVPFRDLANQLHFGLAFATIQIGGNLLVFAALGFFLPIRFRVGPGVVLVLAAACSCAVEILQWVLRLGRFSSIDDVIVNTTGAVLAACLSRPWWRRRMPAVAPVRGVAAGLDQAGV